LGELEGRGTVADDRQMVGPPVECRRGVLRQEGHPVEPRDRRDGDAPRCRDDEAACRHRAGALGSFERDPVGPGKADPAVEPGDPQRTQPFRAARGGGPVNDLGDALPDRGEIRFGGRGGEAEFDRAPDRVGPGGGGLQCRPRQRAACVFPRRSCSTVADEPDAHAQQRRADGDGHPGGAVAQDTEVETADVVMVRRAHGYLRLTRRPRRRPPWRRAGRARPRVDRAPACRRVRRSSSACDRRRRKCDCRCRRHRAESAAPCRPAG